VLEGGCFAHARRKFFELADVESSARRKARRQSAQPVYPIALEAVHRIDSLFHIERGLNGPPVNEGLVGRKERSAPLMGELHAWLTEQLRKLPRNHHLAKAINYMLHCGAFARFLDDRKICVTNDAAKRAPARYRRLVLCLVLCPPRQDSRSSHSTDRERQNALPKLNGRRLRPHQLLTVLASKTTSTRTKVT
jgi:hypothetical protein